jgi:hypothetical protein
MDFILSQKGAVIITRAGPIAKSDAATNDEWPAVNGHNQKRRNTKRPLNKESSPLVY